FRILLSLPSDAENQETLILHGGLRMCCCYDALDVLRREEPRNRCCSRQDPHEAVRVRLIPTQRREELLHLRWRRGRLRVRTCELEKWQRRLVAPLLVLSHRLLNWPPTGEAGIHGVCEQLCIPEGVADPLCRNRVLMIAGITDQRPARAVGPAEEVEQLGRAS